MPIAPAKHIRLGWEAFDKLVGICVVRDLRLPQNGIERRDGQTIVERLELVVVEDTSE